MIADAKLIGSLGFLFALSGNASDSLRMVQLLNAKPMSPAMEHKALFVGGEPLLREMAETLSHMLRDKYRMYFADNADQASSVIRRTRFDIVVVDVTMPGMDGLQFLSQVVFHQPDCPRIIISSYADRLQIAHCLFVGHRYFSKPCDANELGDLLLRLSFFRDVVHNQKVRRVIGGLGSLPGPPETFLKLEELLQSPTSSIEEVSAVVEQDPVLTAKMLQIANSAPFGAPQKISSVNTAIQMLGLATVRVLALGLQIFTDYNRRSGKKIVPSSLWDHSLRVAAEARRISRQRFDAATADRAFLAGLLHDVGKIVVHASATKECAQVDDLVQRCEIPSVIAESQRFGATYGDIGAYLLTLWGIEDDVAAIVQYHDRLDVFFVKDVNALAAVHVAHAADASDPIAHPLQLEDLARLGYPDAETWTEGTALNS